MSDTFITEKIYLKSWWDIPVSYHPTSTNKVIINIPGAGGTSEGYENKYLNLANYLQKRNIASFVRIPNERPQDYNETARTVINYTLEKTLEFVVSETPEIFLMGFSAGGASALLTAWEFPEVTKVLVINPFINLPNLREDIQKYLPRYKGDLFIVIGSEDSVIAPDTLEFLKGYTSSARTVQTHIIEGCDHQLKGESNSKILSQLPEYYFTNKYKFEVFPDAEKGIDLINNY